MGLLYTSVEVYIGKFYQRWKFMYLIPQRFWFWIYITKRKEDTFTKRYVQKCDDSVGDGPKCPQIKKP